MGVTGEDQAQQITWRIQEEQLLSVQDPSAAGILVLLAPSAMLEF